MFLNLLAFKVEKFMFQCDSPKAVAIFDPRTPSKYLLLLTFHRMLGSAPLPLQVVNCSRKHNIPKGNDSMDGMAVELPKKKGLMQNCVIVCL